MKGEFFSRFILTVLVTGVAARLILALTMTCPWDTQSWALIISNIEAGEGLYGLAGYNYTPVWGYFLALVGEVGELLGVSDFGSFFVETFEAGDVSEDVLSAIPTPSFSVMVKSVLILADIAVSYLVWTIVKDFSDRKKADTAFAISFLFPLAITVCGAQGMFDSVGALLTLLAAVLLMRGKYCTAGFFFALAVMTKIYPAFLVFAFAAYVMAKHREDGRAVRNLVPAVLGAFVAVAFVLAPEVANGMVGETLNCIFSRAGNMGGDYGEILGKITVVVYAVILLAMIPVAFRLYRSRENTERMFLETVTLSVAMVFLYPPNAQYLILLLPFLIIQYSVFDRRYSLPLVVTAIFGTVFNLSAGPEYLLSLSAYSDIIGIDTVVGWIESYSAPIVGMLSLEDFVTLVSGSLTYLGVLLVPYTFLRIHGKIR